MDKKGQALSLNTIIIAILIILVLVVVASFFLFGFRGLTDRAKTIFFGVTAGTDRVLAVQSCETYCQQAQLLPNKENSAYCNTFFYIDTDNDGEADYKERPDTKVKEYTRFYCYKVKGDPEGVRVTGNTENLNVGCMVTIKDKTKPLADVCNE